MGGSGGGGSGGGGMVVAYLFLQQFHRLVIQA